MKEAALALRVDGLRKRDPAGRASFGFVAPRAALSGLAARLASRFAAHAGARPALYAGAYFCLTPMGGVFFRIAPGDLPRPGAVVAYLGPPDHDLLTPIDRAAAGPDLARSALGQAIALKARTRGPALLWPRTLDAEMAPFDAFALGAAAPLSDVDWLRVGAASRESAMRIGP